MNWATLSSPNIINAGIDVALIALGTLIAWKTPDRRKYMSFLTIS